MQSYEDLIEYFNNCICDGYAEGLEEIIAPKSQFGDALREQAKAVASAYTLKSEIDSVSKVGEDDDYLYVRIVQTTRKLSGPDFRDNSTESIMIIQKHESGLKLWSTSPIQIELL